MNQLVEGAMQQANEYAQTFLADFWPIMSDANNKVSFDVLEQRKIRLIVHYLFPQLTDWQRSLLVCLFWEHSMLEKLVNAEFQSKELQYRIKCESTIAVIEQKYMELVNGIKESVPFEQLTPLQCVVMKEKFITISFQNAPVS